MDEIRSQLYYASMLHDFGKIILRGDLGGTINTHAEAGADELEKTIKSWQGSKPVIESVKYHHTQSLIAAGLPDNHLAWILQEANLIASGTSEQAANPDGETREGISSNNYDESKCLGSIFNVISTSKSDTSNSSGYYPIVYGHEAESKFISPEPSATNKSNKEEYQKIRSAFLQELAKVDLLTDGGIRAVYNLLSHFASYIPSDISASAYSDISMFEHATLTTAISSCILDYLVEQNITDFQESIYKNKEEFRCSKTFLLVHADLSGIQDFIYTISSKNALKSLRGRSFYLEMILEHIADELLTSLDLSRANLIYSGGGGFYMLTANTDKSRKILSSALDSLNSWLLDNFGVDLYIGLAWSEATPNHFINSNSSEEYRMANVFRAVSQKLSQQKLQRYSDKQLYKLFIPQTPEHGYRECTVCGKSDQLKSFNGEESICTLCDSLIDLGSKLSNKNDNSNLRFVVCSNKPVSQKTLPLPSLDGPKWLAVSSKDKLYADDFIVREYSKNSSLTSDATIQNLWVGDYNYCKGQESGSVEFSNFITMREGKGIERIAVLRADVDNLGNLFVKGLGHTSGDKNIETLSRYAALSRSLSRFFKSHINHIAANNKRNLVIIYAGGDDVFIVGAWDEIIDFAIDLREAFRKFTLNKLSFSAGIGFYRHNYPISRMAALTGKLEETAKQGDKDKIALFGMQNIEGQEICEHVFKWDVFSDQVLSKRKLLLDAIGVNAERETDEVNTSSKSFLYKMLELLITADQDRISLARLAYLLARHEPNSNSSEEMNAKYRNFRVKLYDWATNSETRQELRTAIMLCVYVIRSNNREENRE